jgi:hypothetical protein
MSDFLLLSALICDERCLARSLIHRHAARFGRKEAIGLNLPSVDEAEDNAVGQECSELFREIQGQSRSPGPIAMEEAHLRVETDRFQGRSGIVDKQCIHERQEGVDPVQGWSARPTAEVESVLLRYDQMVEHLKVLPRRFSLDSANALKVSLVFQSAQRCRACGGAGTHLSRSRHVGVVSQGAQQSDAAIDDLSQNEASGDTRTKHGIVGRTVLSPPEQHVSGHRTMDPCQEATALAEERDPDPSFAAPCHQSGAARDSSETDEAFEHVEGHLDGVLAIYTHDSRFALRGDVRTLRGNEEGVVMPPQVSDSCRDDLKASATKRAAEARGRMASGRHSSRSEQRRHFGSRRARGVTRAENSMCSP